MCAPYKLPTTHNGVKLFLKSLHLYRKKISPELYHKSLKTTNCASVLMRFPIWQKWSAIYCISSYKTLPRIILAILIIPSSLTILCRETVVFSNKTRISQQCEIIMTAGLT